MVEFQIKFYILIIVDSLKEPIVAYFIFHTFQNNIF